MEIVMIIGKIIYVIERFYKVIKGKERHVYDTYMPLSSLWSEPKIRVDHLAAGF